MARYVVLIVVFAIMIGIFVAGLDRDPSRLPSPLIDKPVPEYELPTVKDPSLMTGSADFKGQLVLVNVWATWCVGCRQEHPYLLDLTTRYQIPIYGVDWQDKRDEAAAFLEQMGDPYVASAYDEDGRVGIDWGVYGAPETYLVSASGNVLYKHIGPMHEAVWQSEFMPRIAEQTGAAR